MSHIFDSDTMPKTQPTPKHILQWKSPLFGIKNPEIFPPSFSASKQNYERTENREIDRKRARERVPEFEPFSSFFFFSPLGLWGFVFPALGAILGYPETEVNEIVKGVRELESERGF